MDPRTLFWTVAGLGAVVLSYAVGRKQGIAQAQTAALLTQATPTGPSTTPSVITLAAGAQSVSVPTGSQLTIDAPTGGSLTSVAGSSGNTETFAAGTATTTYTVPASDSLTIVWKDSTGAAQTTTLTITAS